MISVMWQYYMARGFGDYLFIFLFFAAFYFLWSMGSKLLAHLFLQRNEQGAQNLRKQGRALAAAVLLLLFLLLITIALSFVIMRPGISEQVISRNNNLLMAADHLLFRVYPPLWFQQGSAVLNATVPFFIAVYYSLTTVLTATLFLLFFLRTRLCLQCILAFFLCAIISMPLWYLFPSISPLIAYWQPILSQEVPTAIAEALRTYTPLPQLMQVMQDSVDFRASVRETALVVTTIPSMHIAWGFLVAYYLTAYSKYLLIFTVPYFLLNSISTVVTMQHYAVDTFGGVAAALIAIYLTRLLSDRYMHIWEPIISLVQSDVRSVRQWIGKEDCSVS